MPDFEIPLRLVVERPPQGVAVAVQRGRTAVSSLVLPTASAPAEAVFELSVRVRPGPPPVLSGDVVQGPPAGRFLYVTWGVRAGQPESRWDRRAKISLTGIGPSSIDAVRASRGRTLEARIAGVGRDGGPACASVPLIGEGWRVAEALS